MPLSPRKQIESITAGVHGGVNYAEFEKLGIDPENVIDFSVSTNPLGIPPEINLMVSDSEASQYPDPRSTQLVREIARKTGVSEEYVLAGSGSTELIRLAVTAYMGETDRAVILGPTYGEYRTACEIAGVTICQVDSLEKNNFRPDIDAVIRTIRQENPKAFFICNPNNPTGCYLSGNEIEKILAAAPDSLVVIDEAYAAFVENRWDPVGLLETGNLLILRSMTKDYTIAGLRLGYAVARREIIDNLRKVMPPWNVNILAQKTGLALLRQDDFIEKNRKTVREGREYLVKELGKVGFRCLPSAVNFFLVEVGDAEELRRQLLRKNIMVRDCSSFGLPRHIRVAVQTMDKNQALISALKDVINDG